MREQTLGDVTRRAVPSMATCSAVAEHQEVKRVVFCSVASGRIDHQSCLIDPSLPDRRMLPADAVFHAHDFALNRRVAGEIQGLRRIGAMTFSASGITDTVMWSVSSISPSMTMVCGLGRVTLS